MPRSFLSLAVAASVVVLAGCSAPGPTAATNQAPTGSPAGSPSSAGSDSPQDRQGSPDRPAATDTGDDADLTVEISGDDVSPNAAELKVSPGETLTISVESDRGGELHVHAKPEQYLDFESGSNLLNLRVDTPGSVEIEDHDTGDVVALLTVG